MYRTLRAVVYPNQKGRYNAFAPNFYPEFNLDYDSETSSAAIRSYVDFFLTAAGRLIEAADNKFFTDIPEEHFRLATLQILKQRGVSKRLSNGPYKVKKLTHDDCSWLPFDTRIEFYKTC